ncbi:hypothetical protein B5807_07787 [Epicoccum nigrum]|uniref:Uncharacterized protein n=1 Tax=Epicoccum nigrum TaxID=105696 RepID=A0A1Y2LWX4_EPING|nr:hypothetical protein B5807_07787 [Epicoccum nigrum]
MYANCAVRIIHGYKCSTAKHAPSSHLTSPHLRRLSNRLLPLRILLDNHRAIDLLAQPLPPRRVQLGRKLQPARSLHRLDRHLEVGQRLLVVNARVGQNKGTERHLPPDTAVLGENDLVEMCRHGNVGGVANHLVRHAPLAVCLALGQVQRPCDDAHAGVCVRQAPAEVLEVRPVVAVEAVADLWAHVAQRKGIVHGLLAPLCVGSRHLVPTVVAAAEVVLELCAELLRDCDVFYEHAVLAVGVAGGQRLRCDVLGHPCWVASLTVVRRRERGGRAKVVDWAREPILEEAVGIDKRCAVGGGRRGDGGYGGNWR